MDSELALMNEENLCMMNEENYSILFISILNLEMNKDSPGK